MSRERVAMTAAEVAAFLDEQRTLTCATLGRDGWPHLMPLWYVIRGEDLWAWTYARAQKVRNLERDPRCTLQVEAGRAYHELRGVMVKAECEIHRDLDVVAALGGDILARQLGADPGDGGREAIRRQAPKRVGLQFRPRSLATWDHRKLGGGY